MKILCTYSLFIANIHIIFIIRKYIFIFIYFFINYHIFILKQKIYIMETKTELLNFRLNPELKTKFTNYCKSNGYSVTKRLIVLIQKDIEDKLK